MALSKQKDETMARLSNAELLEIVEGAESLEYLSSRSSREVLQVAAGTRTSTYAHDCGDRDNGGTFTLTKLRGAAAKWAKEQGYTSSREWYDEGCPDSIEYSAVVEMAIFGEVMYS